MNEDQIFSHLYLSEAYIPVEQEISESVVDAYGKKKLILKGVYSVAEDVNRNKRWYAPELLGREAKRLQMIIEEGGAIISELNHPVVDPNRPETLQRALKTDMERCAMLIKKISFDGKRMYGEGEVTEGTTPGKAVADLARRGYKIPVSTRGTGPQSNKTTPSGAIIVPEQYRMITIDVVTGQSCSEAIQSTYEESYNALYESFLGTKGFKEHSSMKTNMWAVTSDFLKKI